MVLVVKLDPNVTGLLSLVVGRKIQNQKWLIINFLLKGWTSRNLGILSITFLPKYIFNLWNIPGIWYVCISEIMHPGSEESKTNLTYFVRPACRWEFESTIIITLDYCIIYIYLLNGRLKEKVAPFSSSGLFSAHILPPWASTIFFDMNNPSPVPW